MSKYYGKYRAKVHSVKDPEERARIKVLVPSVLDKGVSNWCEPCIPVAYDNGGDFCLPKVGETVWVEFEEGEINSPIWTGNWFSAKNTPLSNYSQSDKIRVISFNGCKIEMNGSTKEMTLSVVKDGVEHFVVLNAESIDKLELQLNNNL